jgi:hypothetical protein
VTGKYRADGQQSFPRTGSPLWRGGKYKKSIFSVQTNNKLIYYLKFNKLSNN